MRLSKIKLSGFKSFVDPTTLFFSGNLIGIVGPNGCGKSNIIDAVTWVMGESSAKHLRSDSMADVIFNGSSARSPVGQAKVELIFDNSAGRVGGQYADYGEISIKRHVNRDGTSAYYLNSTHCRRRDIQDIFLGTGLGARSYAIVEQGTISRLVEAKPDELRSFVEEAAGISKYRERRRETENRMGHTRENLSRLHDIQAELQQQLSHLNKQAKAAQRYKKLKQEERQLHAELLTLDWQVLNTYFQNQEQKIEEQKNLLEAKVAILRKIEKELEKNHQHSASVNQNLQETQTESYRINNEISKFEQNIAHTLERVASINNDIQQINNDEQKANAHLRQDQERMVTLGNSYSDLEAELEITRNASEEANEQLKMAEGIMQSWQIDWDSCNQSLAELTRREQHEQTRRKHLRTEIELSVKRQAALQQQQQEISREEILHAINEQSIRLAELEEQHVLLIKQLNQKREESSTLFKAVHRMSEQLNEKRRDQQQQYGRLSSLEALQQSHFGSSEQVYEWLHSNQLLDKPKLLQKIEVDSDWAQSVETVLGDFLQAVCVDDPAHLMSALTNLPNGTLRTIGPRQAHQSNKNPSCLADKVRCSYAVDELLCRVYVAESMDDARKIRSELAAGESVVTHDGLWLGKNWSCVRRRTDGQHALIREQEIQVLQAELGKTDQEIVALEAAFSESRKMQEQHEQELHTLQNRLQKLQEQMSEARTIIISNKTQLQQTEVQTKRINAESQTLEQQMSDSRREIESINDDLEVASKDIQKMKLQHTNLAALREQYQVSLKAARSHWQQAHEANHNVALQLEAVKSENALLEQAIQRNLTYIENLQKRRQDLDNSQTEIRKPLIGLKKSLEDVLKEKGNVEKRLTEVRESMQQIEAEVRQQKQEQNTQQQLIQDFRQSLEKARLASEGSKVRLQTLNEQLKADGYHLETLLSELPEEAEQSKWQERLGSVEAKIRHLGPINLASINEFSQLSERKDYLEKQSQDLYDALSTLENAIRKIDNETRRLFKETFDKINASFKEKFSLLLGGGTACLALSGDDLLQAGVTVMARPPGKRNSTISQLSGGEKALTAIALIFSIFQLNPAPFCILDEVDAPLDDTNVVRYRDMIVEMSAEVQFIFISHNKATMEVASQLLGITMSEPGVSRLVSVDVDRTLEIIAAS